MRHERSGYHRRSFAEDAEKISTTEDTEDTEKIRTAEDAEDAEQKRD
jgi:hypothetical protein